VATPEYEGVQGNVYAGQAGSTFERESEPVNPDDLITQQVVDGKIKFFNIENTLGDDTQGVRIRRRVVEESIGRSMEGLPYDDTPFTANYYESVKGRCCENVIGMVPIPVGVAGPLLMDGKEYYVPMATTEGALVASTTRGCKAISISGGAATELLANGMARAPVLKVRDIRQAKEVIDYVEANFDSFAELFNSTSRFARLKDIKTSLAGRNLFMRFTCSTGDAMGMNMVGKGVEQALQLLLSKFEGLRLLSLSGNVCTDKKPAAINWIQGRGKSVVAEAIIKGDVVRSVLKTSVAAMVELNISKNLVGSAIAGTMGGNNAHSSNMVSAIFLATGQDPAQNVESSNCMTLMEAVNGGEDLYVSVSMPSVEVGTVGGGTGLPGQRAMLEVLGCAGSDPERPGENAATLAKVVASTVMAGELSLMAALSSGDLIKSHMKLNRKPDAKL